MSDPCIVKKVVTNALAQGSGSLPFCVCVPARNEEICLPVLLQALADQDVDGVVPVAIGLNNTQDGSIAAIDAARRRFRDRLFIQVEETTFSPPLAHAGSARRHAMELGAQALGQCDDGVLISTDADARPPATWVRACLEALAAGADVVGGQLVIDDAEPLSPVMAQGRALWETYWQRVRAVEDAVDPIDWDPVPRHGDHTGASLALRVSTWRAAGGVPAIAQGEDRALVAAALANGARLSHPMSVWTRVSARTVGRADGGMAQHLAVMAQTLAEGRPLMAPSLAQWQARAEWRRRVRTGGLGISLVEAEAHLPEMVADMALADLMEAA